MSKQYLLSRLWIYQKERFPVFKHGILIASFSFCALCLSSLLRNNITWPNWQVSITAFVCLFLFFLQLRIADEFKDSEDDAKYRPERPVPRGLVSLSELKWLGIISAIIQLFLSYQLYPPLIFVLILVWVYMALMGVEFFIPTWLKNHPLAYLWTHMLIMPLIDLFATACDWLQLSYSPPDGLTWFLVVSFFNGVIIEIGRKTWAPEQEIQGVESYSSCWGIQRAILAWLGAVIAAFVCACVVAMEIGFFFPVFIVLALLALVASSLTLEFIHRPTSKLAKRLDNFSGIWVIGLYFILGIIPLGQKLWLG